jgi:D-3-phosphoglycerate dehydrogenase / 2-oxoglutarate reductase
MNTQPIHLLINLPAGFFTIPALAPIYQWLEALGEVRKTSCNSADEILPHLQWADVVLMWSWPKLTPQLLDACPNLRFSANLDITQDGARILLERGVPVSVARHAFSPAVAEMALALILAALRRTSSYHAAMWQSTETWVRRFPDDIDPDERQLTGRNVGIVGFGQVGQRLAQLLAPFDCDIQIYDPFLPTEVATKFGVKSVSLEALTHHAEILVLCAAANAGTKHLLTADHIAALPAKSVLVNVARATLVDNEALLARLKRGDRVAALDVFEQEPLPLDSEWRTLPNVYLTPHRAGGIMASVVRILTDLADDLEAFVAGKPLRHALTAAMLPALDA